MARTTTKSKKLRLREWLAERNLEAVSEADWPRLLDALAPISDDALRRLLHAEGVPAALPYGGIRQSSFDDLASSLIGMHEVYAAAVESGDRERAALCRRLVIQAKDRATMLSRNPKIDEDKRRQKAEMRQWMLVWLENPEVFEVWVGLRKPKLPLPTVAAQRGPPASPD